MFRSTGGGQNRGALSRAGSATCSQCSQRVQRKEGPDWAQLDSTVNGDRVWAGYCMVQAGVHWIHILSIKLSK